MDDRGHPRGPAAAPTPAAFHVEAREPAARMPWGRVVRLAFDIHFAHLTEPAPEDQRRIGLVATVLGAFVTFLGLAVGWALARALGWHNRYLYGGAAYGGAMLGIGAYRVGVSYFPALAGTSRWASLARMLYVLVVLCVFGAGALWIFLGQDA